MVKKKGGLGLLPRLLMGVLIPILLAFMVIWSLVFYSWNIGGRPFFTSIKDNGSQKLTELKTFFLTESRTYTGGLVEKIIKTKALDVAGQMEVVFRSNPKMKKEDLLRDPVIHSIAVQKVGEMGYTAVYDAQGLIYFHVDPKLVGMSLSQIYGRNPELLKIMEAGAKGPTADYYDWKDADGRVHSKYIYLHPIKGSEFIVLADAYVEEFSKPVKAIEDRMRQIEKRYLEDYNKTFGIFFIVILITLLVLMAVVFLFSRSVVHPIKYLSKVADTISMGELNVHIDLKPKGEVGLLVESIERMQDSVKAAIERLQQKRK
jgi:HAMP domain-containing protein